MAAADGRTRRSSPCDRWSNALQRLRVKPGNRVAGAPVPVNTIQMMDRWLTAIGSDQSTDAPAVKVARNRPADVEDACFTEQGERIVEPASYTSQGRCNQLYPPHADPRVAAGAPLTNDILECELKPIEAKDYTLPFTTEQMVRLKALFPQGVCDFSRPGIGRRPLDKTWIRYSAP